ncbi:MAG: carotenoid oxygenase family protein [Flavobacteriales bacterium]
MSSSAHTAPAYMERGFLRNSEECEIDALTIEGEIPSWLNGELIRNGPGQVSIDKPMKHWFDGLAMLHRFQIKNGMVGYRSRFIDCKAYRAAQEEGRISYSDFATDPCRTLFQQIQTIFNPDPKITDSAKVNVGQINGKTFAWGEPLMQIQVDPNTLKTVGVYDYGKYAGNRMTTAHPLVDENGAYNLVVQYGPINFYKIYEISGEARELASVPVRSPGYMHSFGMSDRYFIIAEFPLVVQSIMLLFRARPFIENFHWKPSMGSRFIIMDRVTGKRVSSIHVPAFFSFHHVFAREVNGALEVDLCTYENADIIHRYYKDELAAEKGPLPKGTMRRFRLDVQNGRCLETRVLAEACLELPIINGAFARRNSAYQFVYGCGVSKDNPNEFYNQLVKLDIEKGTHIDWYRRHHYPGEPVFVPAPGATREDDGVLLSVVLDADHGSSYLLVLNAANLETIAKAAIPHSILFGYHGTFLTMN